MVADNWTRGLSARRPVPRDHMIFPTSDRSESSLLKQTTHIPLTITSAGCSDKSESTVQELTLTFRSPSSSLWLLSIVGQSGMEAAWLSHPYTPISLFPFNDD